MPKVFVAGHNGMVGSSICRKLDSSNVQYLTIERSELDLLDQKRVRDFFIDNRFEQVFIAAAKVGGIQANNSFPAEFIYENLTIQNNIIHSSYETNVQRLLFLGSSCIYPKFSNQPIKEDELLSGKLESTNEPYALAKIAGIKMCESYNRQFGTDFRSLMPTNLYGPKDNFDLENSHVVPALLRKFHEAKVRNEPYVEVWGSGKPLREFLHVDDLASASIFIMDMQKSIYDSITEVSLSHLNVGSGKDCSIQELANLISKIVDFKGEIKWDSSKPDGTPRKLMDSGKISRAGWKPTYDLSSGLENTYEWYLQNLSS